MRLLVIRHAKAVPESHLTRTGKLELLKQIRIWKKFGLTLDKLAVSPFLRARQTAKLLRKKIPVRQKIEVWPELASEADTEPIMSRLKNETAGCIALVGHNPTLSDLICKLLYFKPHSLTLEPSGIAILDIAAIGAETQAELVGWLNPTA